MNSIIRKTVPISDCAVEEQGDHLVTEPKPGHFLKPIPYLRNML